MRPTININFNFPELRPSRLRLLATAVVLLCCSLLSSIGSNTVHAADQKHWERSPYRIRIQLAVDDSQSPQPRLGERISTDLKRQIRATLYPLWKTEIFLTSGLEKQRLLTQLDRFDENAPRQRPLAGRPKKSVELSESEQMAADKQAALELAVTKKLDELAFGFDKQIFVTIVSTPLGTLLKSREFDCTTRRWGLVQERSVPQAWMLSSQCFELISQTFAPLATIRAIENDDKNITLHFRGSDLPRLADLSSLNVLGEAYQPLMVRTSSSGEIKTNSIREIAWTYLSLTSAKEEGWLGAIHTGTRRPFGVRRRGRVEHLALAIRQPTDQPLTGQAPAGPQATTQQTKSLNTSTQSVVRFYARHDVTRSLSGYEVFRREPNSTQSVSLGLTDAKGSITIPAGENKVALLFLRSEGQLLAKFPVVPGARSLVQIPIADDTSRLRAQAALTSLTEQLIDTVAQRNILIARVRARLEQKQIDKAQELFTVLDNLPGQTYFDQRIRSAENSNRNRSSDPKVQARIDKLFSNTRKLLGRFLSNKPISKVQVELTTARRVSKT